MCGIIGGNKYKSVDKVKDGLKSIMHRGIDDNTIFSFDDKMYISHNRLSIIDPLQRSNQPFLEDELVLSFNGEIYNHKELRKKLEFKGYNFLTSSDTEVIIKLFKEYGIDSFRMLSGIFSIALYDKRKDCLYLIRDIVGIKPLYYLYDNLKKKFFFSSLIKPLLLNLESKEINNLSVLSYANFNRNDFAETFFKKIFKVIPGELIIFDNKNKILNKEHFLKYNFNYNYDQKSIKKNIENIFSNQFVSDVPVALSLSGGIDSNLIFSELIKSQNKFNCYSVFFSNSKKHSNDFLLASELCRSHNIDLTPVEVSPKDFINYSEKIVNIVESYDGIIFSERAIVFFLALVGRLYFIEEKLWKRTYRGPLMNREDRLKDPSVLERRKIRFPFFKHEICFHANKIYEKFLD